MSARFFLGFVQSLLHGVANYIRASENAYDFVVLQNRNFLKFMLSKKAEYLIKGGVLVQRYDIFGGDGRRGQVKQFAQALIEG